MYNGTGIIYVHKTGIICVAIPYKTYLVLNLYETQSFLRNCFHEHTQYCRLGHLNYTVIDDVSVVTSLVLLSTQIVLAFHSCGVELSSGVRGSNLTSLFWEGFAKMFEPRVCIW